MTEINILQELLNLGGSVLLCGCCLWIIVSIFAVTAVMLGKKSDRGAGREE